MDNHRPRNRSGCWKCKERRVRCTGERPTCQSCTKRGQQCQYGLRLIWEEDNLSKGTAHGRQGVWSKARGTSREHHLRTNDQRTRDIALRLNNSTSSVWKGRPHFVNTTFQTFQKEACRTGEDEDEQDHLGLHVSTTVVETSKPSVDYFWTSTTRSPQPALPYVAFNTDEGQLWSYFVEQICPSCTLSESRNPYLDYIAPLAFHSKPLRCALMGIAAAEMEWRTGDSRYSSASVEHKVKALRALHEDIAAVSVVSDAKSLILQIAATTLMLCFFEIAESCSPSWTLHLKGARNICDGLLMTAPDLDPGFRRFYLMWFVSHETMAHTAWRGDTLFDTGTCFAGDDEEEIDTVMGCSRGLMHAISSVSALATESSHDPDFQSSPSFRENRDKLERRLHALRQTSTGDSYLDSIAETKRYCALIYLHARLDNLKPGDAPITRLTTRVLALLKTLPLRGTLLWIIYVVGSMGVQNEDDRRQVLDMLQALIDFRPLSSIRKARAATIRVWKDRDLGRSNRWEELIPSRRGQLSLA